MSRVSIRSLLLLVGLAVVLAFAWRSLAARPVATPVRSPAKQDRESAVIGVVLNAQARAYPLDNLGAEVLDDELGGQPIVVTF